MKLLTRARLGTWFFLLLPLACGAGLGTGDGQGGEPNAGLCRVDKDCADDDFCNGAETCDPGSKNADQHGCVPARERRTCDDGIACTRDECSSEEGRCVVSAPDEDEDGHADAACIDAKGRPLGDDCDDSDPERYPGNFEVCDASDHDEDCDPETVGLRDDDGDGETSDECCNENHCGSDCNDGSITQRSGQAEFCDEIDNNCDGKTDNSAKKVRWYPDKDKDGFGVWSDDVIESCEVQPGRSVLPTDCDDDSASIHPARDEKCGDKVDNDCDGIVDEGEDCEKPEGTPVCKSGRTWCGTKCVDVESDETSCGECFARCASDEVCSGGKCREEAETGTGGAGSGSSGGAPGSGGKDNGSGGGTGGTGGTASGGSDSGTGGELNGQVGTPPAGLGPLLVTSFEGSTSGYTRTGQWREGSTSGRAPTPKSGSKLAGTDLDGEYVSEVSRLTSDWIEVPEASLFPYLRYDYWYEFAGNDYGHIQIRTRDDDTWREVQDVTGALSFIQGQNPHWMQGIIPLELFGGEDIQVAFVLEPGTVSGPTGAGFFVDNIELWQGIMNICSCQGFNGAERDGDWSIDGGQFAIGQPGYSGTNAPPTPYGSTGSDDKGYAGTGLSPRYQSLPRARSARLVSPSHHVRTDTMRAEFWLWHSLSPGTSVRTQIRHIPGHWEDFDAVVYTGEQSEWTKVTLPLSSYRNLSIQIGFLLDNGGGSAPIEHAGFFVDEFNFLD